MIWYQIEVINNRGDILYKAIAPNRRTAMYIKRTLESLYMISGCVMIRQLSQEDTHKGE